MCELCKPNERHIPSVGDLLLLDAIEAGLLNARGYYVHQRFRAWRLSVQDAKEEARQLENNLHGSSLTIDDLEEENSKLRSRLTKIDEAITKNMTEALRLLHGVDNAHNGPANIRQLRDILTSLRDQYGPKQPTPKR